MHIFSQREYWASDTTHRLHKKEAFYKLYVDLQMGYKLELNYSREFWIATPSISS